MEKLREPEIKAATIDWLESKGILDQSTLVNELVVANSERRVDLAIINDHLHAYEIKSDADSLSRLEGQIETYLNHFDKVTLICTKKFTHESIRRLPREVEIVEIQKNHCGNHKLTTKQRGRRINVRTPEGFLSFVEKKSILKLLRSHGIACPISISRVEAYKLAENLNIKSWRNWTTKYLKEKYADSHSRFMQKKNHPTDPRDLIELRKNYRETLSDELLKASNNQDANAIPTSPPKGVDITNRLSRHGFTPMSTVKIIPKKARG